MSEPSKRYITDYFATSKDSPGLVRKSKNFPDLPDELRARLETVPRLARKNVSDGYKFNTNIPSYRGLTTGPTRLPPAGSFEFGDQMNGKRSLTIEESASTPIPAGRSKTDYPTPSSRSFMVEPNKTNKRGYMGDEDTDDENDDSNEYANVRVISSSHRGLASKSQSMPLNSTNDFEDADFLMSREVIFKND